MHIILDTKHLYLRRFTGADALLIRELNSFPEVVKYVHEPVMTDLAKAEDVLLNVILPQYERNLGRWAMHQKADDAFVGWCGLKYRPELDEIDLGYRLHPSYWGKGYASEAALATLTYGHEQLGLSKITGRAHVENIASLKILRKIGMQFRCLETVDDCPVETYDSFQF